MRPGMPWISLQQTNRASSRPGPGSMPVPLRPSVGQLGSAVAWFRPCPVDAEAVLGQLGALHFFAHPHRRHAAARPLYRLVSFALVFRLGLGSLTGPAATRGNAATAAEAFFETYPPSWASWDSK